MDEIDAQVAQSHHFDEHGNVRDAVIDRALGACVGACIGDASGAPLEKLAGPATASQLRRALRMEGGGAMQLAAGQVRCGWSETCEFSR